MADGKTGARGPDGREEGLKRFIFRVLREMVGQQALQFRMESGPVVGMAKVRQLVQEDVILQEVLCLMVTRW